MKILKVIYNEKTSYILDLIDMVPIKIIINKFNIDNYKEKKKAIPIMTRHGTTQVPLLVFENENLDEYAAIWSESKPNWIEAIIKILND